MKPKIGYISLLSTIDILDEIDFAVKNNFDYLGIALDWIQNQNIGNNKLLKIRKISKAHNLKLSIHSHFYLPTSTMLPEIRRGLYKTTENIVSIAAKVGAATITVHPGYRESVGPSSDITINSLINNLTVMVNIAKRKGIIICFENYSKESVLLCYNIDEYKSVISRVKDMKITLDIGHINTTNHNIIDYTNAVKEHIFDMHIHNNDGQGDNHKGLQEGSINYHEFFNYCKSIDYNGPFMLELFPHENIIKGKNQLKAIWDNVI